MASTRGRCPKCRLDYADLWDHLAKKHKSVLWTPAAWRKVLAPSSFSHLTRVLSLILVRARARLGRL